VEARHPATAGGRGASGLGSWPWGVNIYYRRVRVSAVGLGPD
jgi:hypothetical protein